jgi:hypothetical protein
MEEIVEGLERIVKFYPAFDKRSNDPKKDFGIHGVELLMLLKGPAGAIQFKVFTNWMLPSVQAETDDRMLARCEKIYLRCLYHPMAVDIGYHSYIPRHEGQTIITDKCEWLEGKPCYYDGSSLNAEPVLALLIAEGSDAVWKELESWYKEKLCDKD